jgi:hypothetical protein
VSSCLPANWEAECAKLDPPRKVLPLWWRSRCISYDLNVKASKYVALEDVQNAMARASLAWTSRSCPTGGARAPRA